MQLKYNPRLEQWAVIFHNVELFTVQWSQKMYVHIWIVYKSRGPSFNVTRKSYFTFNLEPEPYINSVWQDQNNLFVHYEFSSVLNKVEIILAGKVKYFICALYSYEKIEMLKAYKKLVIR